MVAMVAMLHEHIQQIYRANPIRTPTQTHVHVEHMPHATRLARNSKLRALPHPRRCHCQAKLKLVEINRINLRVAAMKFIKRCCAVAVKENPQGGSEKSTSTKKQQLQLQLRTIKEQLE